MYAFCSTHMQDLQEVTQEVHYENYRSERLAKGVNKKMNGDVGDGHHHVNTNADKDRILLEKEAELRRMQEMITQMQAKMLAPK